MRRSRCGRGFSNRPKRDGEIRELWGVGGGVSSQAGRHAATTARRETRTVLDLRVAEPADRRLVADARGLEGAADPEVGVREVERVPESGRAREALGELDQVLRKNRAKKRRGDPTDHAEHRGPVLVRSGLRSVRSREWVARTYVCIGLCVYVCMCAITVVFAARCSVGNQLKSLVGKTSWRETHRLGLLRHDRRMGRHRRGHEGRGGGKRKSDDDGAESDHIGIDVGIDTGD